MQDLDVHLGGQRPFGYSYWPLPEDDPGVELPRESVRLVSPDGALVRGLLWLPPDGKMSKTAVILSPTPKTVDSLMRLDLPAGIDIEIKL